MTNTAKHKKRIQSIVKLKNPLLAVHMKEVLGTPRSEKYKMFMKSLQDAKKRIFGTKLCGNHSRTKKMYGGFRMRLYSKIDETKMKRIIDFANQNNILLNNQPLTLENLYFKRDKNGNLSKSIISEKDLYSNLFPVLMNIYTKLVQKFNKLTDEDELEEIRKDLMFVIELLREINLYSNPIWFDDIYYYYYYLNLDKWLSMAKPLMKYMNMDNFQETGPEGPSDNLYDKERGMGMYVDLYASRSNDVDIENTQRNRFVPYYRMKDKHTMEENMDGINHWLNLIYYRPFNPKVSTTFNSFNIANEQ